MFAANTYPIRTATADDIETLNRLAAHRSVRPLDHPVLIGERRGSTAAALSLSDGRVIADDSPETAHVSANLRIRAISIWAYETAPDLTDRMHGGLPAWYRVATPPVPAATAASGERDALIAAR